MSSTLSQANAIVSTSTGDQIPARIEEPVVQGWPRQVKLLAELPAGAPDVSQATGVLPVANGGTGASSAGGALAALGALISSATQLAGNVALTAADRGKLFFSNGGTFTITVPALNTLPVGFAFVVDNFTGDNSIMLASGMDAEVRVGESSLFVVISASEFRRIAVLGGADDTTALRTLDLGGFSFLSTEGFGPLILRNLAQIRPGTLDVGVVGEPPDVNTTSVDWLNRKLHASDNTEVLDWSSPDNRVGLKVAVPATAASTGVVGQWAADATHFYVCTATNTWRRANLAAW